MNIYVVTAALIVICAIAVCLVGMSGSGGMERMTTLTGVYSICKPDGYDAVCFANKSGGGFSCVPFSGVCK